MFTIDTKSIEQECRIIISQIAEINEAKITSEARFIEDLGMDSMMALEVLASLEKRYKIRIPEENLIKVTSLKNIVDLVQSIVNKK